MDAEGAQVLRLRIEQHQHWRLAAGVRDGRQPARDPDAADLVIFDGALRRYEPAGGSPYEKLLVEELWIARRANDAPILAPAGLGRDDSSPSAA